MNPKVRTPVGDSDQESADSFDDMTEDEHLQFFVARDLFISAECARIANLQVEGADE